jgi:hypothetical protein
MSFLSQRACVQGPDAKEETNQGRDAHQVIQLQYVVKARHFGIQDYTLRPIRFSDDRVCRDSFLHPVAKNGGKIPNYEEDARYLDETPSSLSDEIVRLEPVNQYSHGNGEKGMCQLMRIKPFRSRMGLEGPA